LMAALVAADEPMMELSEPAESVSVIHCDAATICPDGTTCCLSPYGVWYCCPFSMVRSVLQRWNSLLSSWLSL
ncbi:hypothetical protein cypCar_00050436, partial [Cyprinus carpio]